MIFNTPQQLEATGRRPALRGAQARSIPREGSRSESGKGPEGIGCACARSCRNSGGRASGRRDPRCVLVGPSGVERPGQNREGLAGEVADTAGRDPRGPTGSERVGSGGIEDHITATSWKRTGGCPVESVGDGGRDPPKAGRVRRDPTDINEGTRLNEPTSGLPNPPG